MLLVVALAVAGLGVGVRPALAGPNDPDTPGTTWEITSYPPTQNDNVILKWDEELLQAVRANPPAFGPTVTARAIAVLHTATYDAWAPYDAVANPTIRPSGWGRQASSQRTVANKNKAISFAAYRALMYLFPSRQADYEAQMRELDYTLTDTSAAAMVGNNAAQRVIDLRSRDGSNQAGGYADTTGYQPVNTWDRVVDRWRWQPLCVPNPNPDVHNCPGGVVQKALTPQWGRITPFALNPYSPTAVPGPARLANGQYDPSEVTELYAETVELSDEEKVRAEYWADGPKSEFPPGHWAVFGQILSRRRGHTVDTDAKMFFALGNALLDASIAAWQQKYKYDFVRPVTAIRERYRGQMIESWLGPYQGWGEVPAEQWKPYQAPGVVTPPFPEYVSGHSTFSAAAAYVLRGFTGSDVLGASVRIPAGSSLFEPRTATEPGTPAADVTLRWDLLTDAANDAGVSRRNGGIHFESGDIHGRSLGNTVGGGAWARARAYIQGRI